MVYYAECRAAKGALCLLSGDFFISTNNSYMEDNECFVVPRSAKAFRGGEWPKRDYFNFF